MTDSELLEDIRYKLDIARDYLTDAAGEKAVFAATCNLVKVQAEAIDLLITLLLADSRGIDK